MQPITKEVAALCKRHGAAEGKRGWFKREFWRRHKKEIYIGTKTVLGFMKFTVS